jgi:hypothetical protein
MIVIFVIILWICSILVTVKMNYEAAFLTQANGPKMIDCTFLQSKL